VPVKRLKYHRDVIGRRNPVWLILIWSKGRGEWLPFPRSFRTKKDAKQYARRRGWTA
jgi:hypothetical protein